MTFLHGELLTFADLGLLMDASPASPPTAKVAVSDQNLVQDNVSLSRRIDAFEYNTINNSKPLLVVNATNPVSYISAGTALLRHCEDAIIVGIHLAVTKYTADKLLIVTNRAMGTSRYALERLCEKYEEEYPNENLFITESIDFQHTLASLTAKQGEVKTVALEDLYDIGASQNENLQSRDSFITVLGEDVNSPGNYLASVGKQIMSVLESAQINASNDARILLINRAGEKYVGKPTDIISEDLVGVIMLPQKGALHLKVEACHHCGACVSACPMGLEPVKLSWLSRLNNAEHALQNGIMDCIECGACSFACAAARPLMDYIREGKRLCGLQQCV